MLRIFTSALLLGLSHANNMQKPKKHHDKYQCAKQAPFKPNDFFEWANCHWNMEHPQECEKDKPKRMMQCRVVCEEYIEPEHDGPNDRIVRECENKAIDLVFLVDGSGSVKADNFDITKQFMHDVIEHLDLHTTHVSIVQFSDHNTLEIANATDRMTLEHTVDNMGYHDGADTLTGAGITFTQDQVFASVSRANATQVLIIITDGDAKDEFEAPIKRVQRSGVVTVAVGVGGFNVDQLEVLASEPKYVHTEADFTQLEDLKEELTEEICRIKKPTTTTTTQATSTTRPSVEVQCESAKIDLTFLIDGSGSVGFENFELTKAFLFNVVQHLDVSNDHTRVNMVQYSNRTEVVLSNSTRKVELLAAIPQMHYQDGYDTFTGAGVTFTQEKIFAHYSRPDAAQVFIVLTDGQSTDDLSAPIAEVHAAGITTIAIGVGSGVDVDELKLIASDDQYVYEEATFEALQEVQEELTEQICRFVITRPTV